MSNCFAGIDPGAVGGLAVIDSRGEYVAAHRWDTKEPEKLYQALLIVKTLVPYIYLEQINVHPGEGIGNVVRNSALVENVGIWKGFLMAAGLPWVLVHPGTWQAGLGLRNWQKLQAKGINCHSPLSLARLMWPGAPLEHKADDGKAVALLLAEFARRDRQKGIDRAALNEFNAAKLKEKKRAERAARKAAKALPQFAPPGPAPGSPLAAPGPGKVFTPKNILARPGGPGGFTKPF